MKHYSVFAEGESPYIFSMAWAKPYKCKYCDSFFKTEPAVYQHCRREVFKERTKEERVCNLCDGSGYIKSNTIEYEGECPDLPHPITQEVH